jgi:hypothetical protein
MAEKSGTRGWHVYEHHSEPLLPRRAYYARLLWHAAVGFTVILASLAIGVAGYRYLAGLSWVDALLNAAMILGGMGPVDELRSVGAKLFASVYALFAGMVFLVTVGILVAPVAHRLLHRLHLEPHAGTAGSDD